MAETIQEIVARHERGEKRVTMSRGICPGCARPVVRMSDHKDCYWDRLSDLVERAPHPPFR